MNLAEGGPVDERASQLSNSSTPSITQDHVIQSSKMSNPSISHLQAHPIPSSINPGENLSSSASSKSLIHDQNTSAMNVRFKVCSLV